MRICVEISMFPNVLSVYSNYTSFSILYPYSSIVNYIVYHICFVAYSKNCISFTSSNLCLLVALCCRTSSRCLSVFLWTFIGLARILYVWYMVVSCYTIKQRTNLLDQNYRQLKIQMMMLFHCGILINCIHFDAIAANFVESFNVIIYTFDN